MNDLQVQKGLAYLEAEEKALAEKKLASEIRNKAWLKEQRKVKEQEYNRAWNKAEEDLVSQIENAKKEVRREEFSKAWVEEARLQNEIAKEERKVLEQKQIKKGLDYLEAEEKALAEKKLASEIRNKAWLKEQRKVKEQEYNRAWNKAEEDLVSQIENAKKEVRREEFSKAWVEEARLQNEIAKEERKVLEQKQIKKGLDYLEAEEKALAEKKLASEIRNEAWLKEQRQIKEQEYNKIWNEAEEVASQTEEKVSNAQEVVLKENAKTNKVTKVKSHPVQQLEKTEILDEQKNKSELMRFIRSLGIFRKKEELILRKKSNPPSYKKTGFAMKDAISFVKFKFEKFKRSFDIRKRKKYIIGQRLDRGCGSRSSILETRLLVQPKITKNSQNTRNYAYLSGLDDTAWEANKITRKEFMQNKRKYMSQALDWEYQKVKDASPSIEPWKKLIKEIKDQVH